MQCRHDRDESRETNANEIREWRQLANEFVMNRRVDRVQMQFRPRHFAERSGMLVVLPASFRAHDYNLVAKEFAGLIVLRPERRQEDFEQGMRRKSLPWTRRETKNMRIEVLRNIFRKAGLHQPGSAQRQKPFGAGFGSRDIANLIKGGLVL